MGLVEGMLLDRVPSTTGVNDGIRGDGEPYSYEAVQLLVLLATLVLVLPPWSRDRALAHGPDAGTGDSVQDARVYVNGDYAGKSTETGEFSYSHA